MSDISLRCYCASEDAVLICPFPNTVGSAQSQAASKVKNTQMKKSLVTVTDMGTLKLLEEYKPVQNL